MSGAIEVHDLTKVYGRPGSGVLAVDHIGFEVHEGEIFGFLGPNGAGKTTTQRMLTTLLEPTEGRIVIFGHDLAREAYPVKRQMGLVPEESNVYTELTAWDNLMFTAQLYRVPRGERAERAQQLLETFGLWEKRDVKIENFSKGMRRRLSIAMAIIHRPTGNGAPRNAGRQAPTPRHERSDGRWTVKGALLQRLQDELAQAWTVVVKDLRTHYLRPGMIMFGFMMPFFMFFSFSVRREMAAAQGVARLLALTTFFTAAAAGPFIIPLERRLGTYDRLLAAPMSLLTLLLGKASVGALFAIGVSAFSLLVGVLAFGATIARPWLLVAGVILGSFSFSALGLIFGSIPTRNPGDVQMPSTLLRWGLLFISGTFVPLAEMAPTARAVAYLSPLTYAQDLMNHAVLGTGLLSPWLDLLVLLASGVLFMLPPVWMHRRGRVLGY